MCNNNENNNSQNDQKTNIDDDKKALSEMELIFPYLKDVPIIKTIPAIFNMAFNENFISDYLAYILDPKYNGVGVEPLHKIIEKCNDEISISEINPEDIEIIREYSFENNKRIDIIIVIKDKLIIGIENKIHASESAGQTKGYEDEIKKRFPDYSNFLLLFLNKKEEKAESEKFISITYSELTEILEDVKLSILQNIKQRIIFEDFIEHIKRNFVMSKSIEISDSTKLYLKHSKMIDELIKSKNVDSKNILENILACRLEEKWKEKFGNEDWEYRLKQKRDCQQIKNKKWERLLNKKWGETPHFEFWIGANTILTKPIITFTVEIHNQNVIEQLCKKIDKSVLFSDSEIERPIALSIKDYDNPFIKEDYQYDYCEEMIDNVIKDFTPIIEEIDNTINKIATET